MKDKEKQIEEIFNDIVEITDRPYYYDNKGHAHIDFADLDKLAEKLSEKYQPKLLENSVVLSKEEWTKRMSIAKRNFYLEKRVEKEIIEKLIMEFYHELITSFKGRVITYDSFCKIAQKHNVEIPRETFTLAELEAKHEDVEVEE